MGFFSPDLGRRGEKPKDTLAESRPPCGRRSGWSPSCGRPCTRCCARRPAAPPVHAVGGARGQPVAGQSGGSAARCRPDDLDVGRRVVPTTSAAQPERDERRDPPAVVASRGGGPVKSSSAFSSSVDRGVVAPTPGTREGHALGSLRRGLVLLARLAEVVRAAHSAVETTGRPDSAVYVVPPGEGEGSRQDLDLGAHVLRCSRCRSPRWCPPRT